MRQTAPNPEDLVNTSKLFATDEHELRSEAGRKDGKRDTEDNNEESGRANERDGSKGENEDSKEEEGDEGNGGKTIGMNQTKKTNAQRFRRV